VVKTGPLFPLTPYPPACAGGHRTHIARKFHVPKNDVDLRIVTPAGGLEMGEASIRYLEWLELRAITAWFGGVCLHRGA
jgi:hypothetical protein